MEDGWRRRRDRDMHNDVCKIVCIINKYERPSSSSSWHGIAITPKGSHPSRFQSAAHSCHQIKSRQASKHATWAGIGDWGSGIPSKTKPDQQRHARLIMEMSSDVDSSPCEVSNRTAEMEKYIHLVRAICLQCLDTCDNFKQHLHGNLLNSCDSLLSYFCWRN